MSDETIRVRLAKMIAALIVKLKRWEDASKTDANLLPGVELMRAQIQYAKAALDQNSPIGLIQAVGELDVHTDLGC